MRCLWPLRVRPWLRVATRSSCSTCRLQLDVNWTSLAAFCGTAPCYGSIGLSECIRVGVHRLRVDSSDPRDLVHDRRCEKKAGGASPEVISPRACHPACLERSRRERSSGPCLSLAQRARGTQRGICFCLFSNLKFQI